MRKLLFVTIFLTSLTSFANSFEYKVICGDSYSGTRGDLKSAEQMQDSINTKIQNLGDSIVEVSTPSINGVQGYRESYTVQTVCVTVKLKKIIYSIN